MVKLLRLMIRRSLVAASAAAIFPSYEDPEELTHKHLGLPEPIRVARLLAPCGSVYVGY